MKPRLLPSFVLILVIFSIHTPAQAQEGLPYFEPADCPINVPEYAEIDCGYLIAPEDYANLQGRTVKLPIIIIRNRTGNPDPEAIIYTDGGPAYSSLNSVWWLANTRFVEDRDIIIIEQRGNLFAEPSLDCDITVLWEETADNTACLDSLRGQGIDLAQYTTANIAADIDLLRQALDYQAWNLLGTSYSTRLMQLVLNKQPDDIRSAILLSVAPMTETRYQHDPEHSARAIQVMLDDCAADPACTAAYPDLETQLYDLIANLNANPVFFELSTPGTGIQFDYEVTGHTLMGWMVNDAFYEPAYHPFMTAYLPLLITEVSAGNTDMMRAWVKEDFYGLLHSPFAWGLYFTVNCQDFAPYTTIDEVNDQVTAFPMLDGYSRHGGELDICNAWQLPPAFGLLAEPVSSDIPTLIIGGSYDPITPPEWSRTAAVNLTNSTFVEIPSAGHNTLDGTICPDLIILDFLDDPGGDLDLSCLNDIHPPRYTLPKEIIIAPKIYEIQWDEIGGSLIEENIFLGSLLVQGGAATLILITAFGGLLRARKPSQNVKGSGAIQPLAVGLATLSLLWALGLRYLLREVAENAPIILRFGMPAVTWQIFAVAILIAVLSVVLGIFTYLALKRRYWSVYHRILVSLVSLSALVFSGMLGYWGILTALFSLL